MCVLLQGLIHHISQPDRKLPAFAWRNFFLLFISCMVSISPSCPLGRRLFHRRWKPEQGGFSIPSSEVLGLRSTLTSCLGDNAPNGVIVGRGETCSHSPVTLHLPQNKRHTMQGMVEIKKIDGHCGNGVVKFLMVGLGRQIQFVKGLRMKIFSSFTF